MSGISSWMGTFSWVLSPVLEDCFLWFYLPFLLFWYVYWHCLCLWNLSTVSVKIRNLSSSSHLPPQHYYFYIFPLLFFLSLVFPLTLLLFLLLLQAPSLHFFHLPEKQRKCIQKVHELIFYPLIFAWHRHPILSLEGVLRLVVKSLYT